MESFEARKRRDLLADLGVVLHRAGTERIEVRINAEVQLRKPRVMPDHVELADFRQFGGFLTEGDFRQMRFRIHRRDVERGKSVSAAFRLGLFEDCRFHGVLLSSPFKKGGSRGICRTTKSLPTSLS